MNSSLDSIAEFLENNNIPDIFGQDDVFLHGIRSNNGLTLKELVHSFFEEGIRMQDSNTARGGSILSTMSLQSKEKPLSEQISKYNFGGVFGGVFNVIVKVPKELEGIYLGNCKQKFGNAGNQDGKNSLLDFLNLPNIPREFIVGISVLTNPLEEKQNFCCIQNPYYYDHQNEKNKEINTKSLVSKLEERIKSKGGIAESLTLGKEPFGENLIEFNKQIDAEDNVFFMEQKNEHLATSKFEDMNEFEGVREREH